MFHIFLTFCNVICMVLGIVNPLSWIFNAISNKKSCLISMPFLSTYIEVRAEKFFPPAESWLVNSNFPSRQLYARSSRHVVFVCSDFVRARKTAKRERDLHRIDVSKTRVWEREGSASAAWMTFLGIICTPEKKICAEREKAKVRV